MPTAIDRRNAVFAIGAAVVGMAWLASQHGRRDTSRFAVPEIDVAGAKALLEAGALAIDVRNDDAFGFRHLPGAIFIPLAALRVAIPAILSEAKAKQIVVYCNDGHTSGPEATDILQRGGFKNARNLTAGVEGWASAGYPFVKGADA